MRKHGKQSLQTGRLPSLSIIFILLIVLATGLLGCPMPAKAQSSEYVIKQQMEAIKQLLLIHNITYFTSNGTACTHGSETSCNNCRLNNIMPHVPSPLYTGAQVYATYNWSSATCVAFARWMFYNLFEDYPDKAGETVSISNAQAGDYIAIAGDNGSLGHAGIFYEWADSSHTTFYLYDGNHRMDCRIHYADLQQKTSKVISVKRSSKNVRPITNVFLDVTPPIVSNVRISDLSNSGYTVTCDVSDNANIARVAFPTWTDKDWQDDIVWQDVWLDSFLSGGTVSFHVNISDHCNQTGKYLTYIYAYDSAGNVSEENDSTRMYVDVDGIPPVVSNIRVSDVSNTGYTITCDVSDNVGVARVAFPTWTNEDWQDDIVWQDGILSGGTASFRVNISDHGNQTGKYLTYIYAYDSAGNVSEENDSTRVRVSVGSQIVEKHQLDFAVDAPWNGTLQPTPYGQSVAPGERVLIHAIEEGNESYYEGLIFDHWESNNGGVFDNPNETDTVFTMPDCDVRVCAVFRGKDSYTLSITAMQGGYVSVTKSDNNVLLAMIRNGTTALTIAPDTTIKICAEADNGYGFSNWICTDNHMSSHFQSFICSMSYRDTSIEAVFKTNPYAMEEDKTFHLPARLQVIESEAFTGVEAVYFDVPSSVRVIETDAFPPNAVVYVNTSLFDSLSCEVITESGIFIEKGMEYNYEFAASLENTGYRYYNACGEVPE